MTPAIPVVDIRIWVVVWLVAALYLVMKYWRRGQSVGLTITYVISFGSIHWLAAVLYLLPWYDTRSVNLVAAGMKQSAIAMAALAIGAEIASQFIHAWEVRRLPERQPTTRREPEAAVVTRVSPVSATWYLVAGLLLYGVVFPFAGRLPTLTALVSTGSAVTVVGVALKCWNAWQIGARQRVWMWLAIASLLPFITIATQGFLGYGMAALVTIYSFVAVIHGPRWKVLLVSVVLGYLGLSVYVTYMRDRGEIRETVWSGSTLSDRFRKVRESLANFEWFDAKNVEHLKRIDGRMNQDWLVGASVAHLGAGNIPFALGSTYRDAVLAVVPRAFWPEKPVSAGSGDLVATYTGYKFAEGTSVGIGQVMECYINFGTPGVIIGFLVIGGLMTLIDRRAVVALSAGDTARFALWYLPGLSLLNVGGSFVEVSSTAGAGLVMAVFLNRSIRRQVIAEAAADERMLLHSTQPETPE